MKNAIKKLKKENGVSILLALLFMAAATMVIFVLLAAANTAAWTYDAESQQQQAYFTVSSAAMYMRDEICDYSCKSVKTITRVESSDETQNPTETKKYEFVPPSSILPPCDFTPLMNGYMEEFEKFLEKQFKAAEGEPVSGEPYEGGKSAFIIKVNASDSANNKSDLFDAVYVTFEMDAHRNINVTMTLREDEVIRYKMTIYLPSSQWEKTEREVQKTEDANGNIITTTIIKTTTQWSWVKGTIARG